MLRRINAIVLSAGLLLGATGLGMLPAERAHAADGPEGIQEVLLNGFENAAEWGGNDDGVIRTADATDKTQGSQSIDVTFPVPAKAGGNQWREFSWDTSASPVDLSDATDLKVDIKPTGGTAPLHFKLIDAAGGGIYEDYLPVLNADAWNTFTLDFSAIPAQNRAAISKIIFYVFNGDDVGGRSAVDFKFDNLRVDKPVVPLSEMLVNGFDNAADWAPNWGDMTTAADTADKTEGKQSYDVTFPAPSGGPFWKEIHWDTTALPVDLSSAETLQFDLKPVGTPTTGDMEPLRFKLDNGGVLYEDAIPTHTLQNGSNPWTVTEGQDGWRTYSLDLTKLQGDRSAIRYFIFYVWNQDGTIAGRPSVEYKFDNLRVMTHQVQGVTASPAPSAVTAGTPVALSTASVGASIYYTTDGTDPRSSASRTKYVSPIVVNETTNIRAYAEIAGSRSAVGVYKYTLGTGVPGEELFSLNNGVADTADRMVAGIRNPASVGEDGFVNDWSGAASFKLPSDAGRQVKMSGWNGSDDLSADVSLAYDHDNLYLHAVVKDDVQSDKSGGDIWRGDGIQMAFSADGYAYGPEYGFSYNGGSPSKFRWSSGSAKLDVDSVKLKATRDENAKLTTYDIAMPWLAALPAAPNGTVPFTLLINDNDGSDRKGYIEWTPGIGVSPKDATSMGTLALLDADTTWAATLHGPNNGVSGTPYDYVLALPNFGESEAQFHVSVPAANVTADVTVPAGKVVKKTMQVTFAEPGDQAVTATVSKGSETREERIDVAVLRGADQLTEALDALNAKLPALEDLFAQAKAKGIPVAYETVNLAVIKNFIQYGKDDISHSYTSRADYVEGELEALYDEAETNLTAYLNGTKTAKAVPMYVTGRPTVSGGSLIAGTKAEGSDVTQQRPVFLTGYGHFSQAQKDIPQFSDLGANLIQMEIGPNSTVTAPAEGSDADFGIDTSSIASGVLPVLQSAADHNVGVSLLLSPHYFPDWALQKWPDLRNDNGGFLHYNINDPHAKEIVKAYLDTVVPMVKDSPALQSIVISNEPTYDTRTDSYAATQWPSFLEGKYGTIAALNALYGTSYGAFGEVPMPSAKTSTLPFYDWTVFNNKYFSDWHAWMAGIIHELAPDVPVSAKIMAKLDDAVTLGVDPEDFAGFSDLNGDDNWNFLGTGVSGFTKENQFYDLQNSLRQAPVFNSETHVIADRDTVYSPEQAKHVATSLFQSAVHGKSASAIWVWERTYDVNSDFYGSILERPDVVKEVGKTNLDLNRLAYEVTALQNVKPQAAILYSLPSLVYSGSYQDTVDKAYDALALSGQKPGFVSEQQAKDGGLDAYKLLIVPQATNVEASTLNAIQAFVAKGGKVIVVGSDSLAKDENNQPSDAAARSAVIAGSNVLSDASALKQTVREALASLKLMSVQLIDKSTGQLVDGVEWQSAVYKGKLLIDIADYDSASASKNIGIVVNGKPAGTAAELINGGTVNAGEFAIELEKPYLLQLAVNAGNGSSDGGGAGAVLPSAPNTVNDAVIGIAPTLDGGLAKGAITADEFAKAVEQAAAKGSHDAIVALQAAAGAKGYSLQVPASAFAQGGQDGRLTVQTPAGSLMLPLGMFDEALVGDAKTIELTIAFTDAAELGEGVKQAVDVTIKIDGKAVHWNNADAPVTATIPYAPSDSEKANPDLLAVRYIDEAGHAVPVPSGRYDAAAGGMVFKATHFSRYAVVYANSHFGDIAAFGWAKQAIADVTAKGIMSGVSDTRFVPGQSISRAAFTDALVKALGLSASFEGNFGDVPSLSAYYESIGVARELGIAKGAGGGLFRPDAPISRQEMAALVVRAMKAAGLKADSGTAADLKAFADAQKVAAYAVLDMATLVKAGILKGDGKQLLPKDQVTRAQTAVLVDRLARLTS
ncbi:hypothetical protein GZH47_07965 [Paenibacillus rhizovicinus]|uniref:beta-galactosidase n=1 Tax=Paenibacillus rhizovicinus TaxID=2704463 RepID=A0A6C0NX52_9BACL|nr:S-layer homology domain-containing protein [Paenibacillus rhizovicinus]QHW30800.1 hypothetical protein GZH47_07965 [Paenibacillus rhizovicinus]